MVSPIESSLDRSHRRLNNAAGIGFLIGSALFFIGVGLSLNADHLIPAWTFLVGSIFFTAAGTAQLIDSVLPVNTIGGTVHWNAGARWAFGAALAQWIGTIEFNVNTWRGVLAAYGESLVPSYIWRPDALGSVLFLVASALALFPAVRQARHRHVRDRSLTMAWFNMFGSMLFGVAAVGAWAQRSGDMLSLLWSNLGTAGGAVFFFAAALLLIAPSPQRSASH